MIYFFPLPMTNLLDTRKKNPMNFYFFILSHTCDQHIILLFNLLFSPSEYQIQFRFVTWNYQFGSQKIWLKFIWSLYLRYNQFCKLRLQGSSLGHEFILSLHRFRAHKYRPRILEQQPGSYLLKMGIEYNIAL